MDVRKMIVDLDHDHLEVVGRTFRERRVAIATERRSPIHHRFQLGAMSVEQEARHAHERVVSCCQDRLTDRATT
jgi:hypothetical protein